MQDLTPEQIREKYNQLIPEMQEAISSPEILEKIRSVGQKHDLMIDQIGELIDQVALIMLGFARSSDFVRDTSSRLSINNNKAREIATDINTEIFDSLKNILRGSGRDDSDSSPDKVVDNSSLERAGGFEIEPDMSANGGDDLRNPNTRGFSAFSSGDKADMVSNIENPVPTMRRVEQKTEPLVDQLLHGSTSSSEQKVEINTTIKPVQKPANIPQPPANLPTNDPYREAMK